MNIIGMKVMHKKSKMIGTIEEVHDGHVYISFRGQSHKYPYPSAFVSSLEIEDSNIQLELEKMGYSAGFDDFKRLYSLSISNEINFLKSTGGKRYKAVDGERIETKYEEYLYAFDTDTDYHFPEGTPIKIWFPDNIVSAYVVSCEDFSMMIRTMEYIGDNVASIEFTAEQWILLEMLMEQLGEMNPTSNSIAYELACKGKSKINPMRSILKGQNTAVRRGTSEKITFIWGPPGTGKTETLARIALDYIYSGKRVLMLSYSNVSVDGALLRVAEKADHPEGQIVRYGYPRVKKLIESKSLTSFQYALNLEPHVAEEYYSLLAEKKKTNKREIRRKQINDRLNQIRRRVANIEKEVVDNAAFVATTISKAVIDKTIYTQMFDVVIFDEASMAYVPQIVFAGGLARQNFVCLGDFRQLPAIVQNDEEERLAQDIFEYTGITRAVENDEGHDWLVMLDKQWRMHKDISDFVSEYMYGGMLQTAEEIIEDRDEIASCGPVNEEAIALVDLSGTYSACIKTMDGSRVNLLSALMCVTIAERYIDKYEVGIITPYSAQSRLILAMIRDLQEKSKRYNALTCATVHQFQGSEKPIIIYDAVDCFRMRFPGLLLTQIKNNTANRLFNVALTRAQGKFILVANTDFLQRKKLSKSLLFRKAIDETKRKAAYIDAEEIIDLYHGENNGFKVMIGNREDSWEQYLVDISGAKKSIHIDVPGLLEENEDSITELGEKLNAAASIGVEVLVRTEESLIIPSCIRKHKVNYGYITTPVTIIDNKTVWFGQPLCAADFITEGEPIFTEFFPCIRFEGFYTSRLLQAIFNI